MKNVFIFLGGLAVGSAVTWKVVKEYYKKIADEEIDSVIETFKNRKEEINKLKKEELKEEKKEKVELKSSKKSKEKLHYNNTIDALKYVSDEVKDLEEKLINQKDNEFTSSIEIISDQEYNTIDEFDAKSWTYWNNDILTDEDDNVVEDYEEIIGEALSQFGEFDDSVYVRNIDKQCDYEILRSEKDFN